MLRTIVNIIAISALSALPEISHAKPFYLPYSTVTYESIDYPNGSSLTQFDPAMGTLIFASAYTYGQATFDYDLSAVPNLPLNYSVKTDIYIYYGFDGFTVPATGNGSLEANNEDQKVFVGGNGSESVPNHDLKYFVGKGTLPLSFSVDDPKPQLPGNLKSSSARGSVSITYTYYPSFKPNISPDWWKHLPKHYPPVKVK